MHKRFIVTVLLVVSTVFTVQAQDMGTVLDMLDHVENRLNQIEKKHSSSISELSIEFKNISENLGDASVNTELVERVSAIETNIANPAWMDRVAAVEAKLSTLEGSPEPQTEPELASLLVDLRALTDELKHSIEKPAKKEAKSIFKPEFKTYFYYISEDDEDGEKAFDISRIYVGAKIKLSDKLTARYRTDIAHEGKTGKLETYVKYGYLDWKLPKDGMNLILGLQGTHNWIASEKAWGYRVIRKAPGESFGGEWKSAKSAYKDYLHHHAEELTDTTGGNVPSAADLTQAADLLAQYSNIGVSGAQKTGSSADIGVGLNWKINKTTYANFLVRNGSGYKAVENDQFKNYQVRVGKYLAHKSIHVSAFAEVEPWEDSDAVGETFSAYNLMTNVFAGYTSDIGFKVGFDYTTKHFPGSYEDVTSTAYSVFGTSKTGIKNLKAFGRYDAYMPGFHNINYDGSLIIAGVDWSPDKHVHIVPNIQIIEQGDEKEQTFYIHVQFSL